MRLTLVLLFLCSVGMAGAQCVDSDQINFDVICPTDYTPVCGCDGVTYSNSCAAINYGGVTFYSEGPCDGGPDPEPLDPCEGLPTAELGPCDALLGWGLVDGHCTSVSGCDGTYLDTDWSEIIYASLEACAYSCDSICLQPALINPNVICPSFYDPVCGCDGVTYSNSCAAYNYGGVTSWTDGPCVVVETAGCTYPPACNYDPDAAYEDGSCIFPPLGCDWPDGWPAGCTYVGAVNYDPNAVVDDGSCLYEDCSGCAGDVDGDNLITVSDILVVLGQFGGMCE